MEPPRLCLALPGDALVCDLDEADRACPQCGDRLEPLAGEAERSEMIDVVELKYRIRSANRVADGGAGAA
jgi:hypothetical protein